jgi:hypothetical protein
MISDGEMVKVKVLDLKELYNFVVANFFTLNHLSKENYVSISPILKFKIFKRSWMEEHKNKLVVLDCTLQFGYFSFEFI